MSAKKNYFKKRWLLCCFIYYQNLKKRKNLHVHPLNTNRHRFGEYFTLIPQLERFPCRFHQYFRMSKAKFYSIFHMIEEDLNPKPLSFRKDSISAKEKVVVTLRFLATGSSFVDLGFRFRMGVSTIRTAINQTIEAIILRCLKIAIPDKRTQSDWKDISNEFLELWNFPNCLAAVDGKHVLTFAPKNSGSLYFNYKKTFSYNLMAAVDARYRFIMVDIGAYGSNADSTVFSSSPFGKAWLNSPELLNIPEDAPLPGTSSQAPFVLIGDEGFALKPTILRPYPGQKLSLKERIFNYRLSRARRVVENAFGIMSHTWRILLKRIEVQRDSAKNIILACCILHNLIRIEICHTTDSKQVNKVQNKVIPSLQSASSGYDIRNQFANWCTSEGDLDFQYKMI